MSAMSGCESTQPNTPRSETDSFTKARTAETPRPVSRNSLYDTTVTSSSSDHLWRRGREIQPTWPKHIEVANAPATVLWQDGRISEVHLNLNWTSQGDGAAFFMLHARVQLVNTRRPTPVYIFIPPERIRCLSLDTDPEEQPWGKHTQALFFDMLQPPALVQPNVPNKPADSVAEDSLRSLHALVTQLSFTVFAQISSRVCAATKLKHVCATVSEQKLRSIEHLGFARIRTLYQGKGGQLLEGSDLRDCVAAPPAYSPPAMPCNKRRRESTTFEEGPALLSDVAFLRKQLAAHQRMMTELHTTFRTEVMELLSAHKAEVKQLVVDQLASVEDRLRDEVVGEIADSVDKKVWEQMAEVEDHVMNRITSVPLRADLTFPDHALY